MRFSLRPSLLSLVLLTLVGSGVIQAETLSLDSGWLFFKGDIQPPPLKGHDATYHSTKAGAARGAAAIAFDDSLWRRVSLPHDWAIEQPPTPEANVSQGYRLRGIGWYRRHFELDEAERGKHLELEFDGVATHCTVWINGILAHRNFCGYTGFTIDFTSFANFGPEGNVVVVRVDAEPMEGWWYEGAGIYRHVRLRKQTPLHLVTDGVHASPVPLDGRRWRIPAEVAVANSSTRVEKALVRVSLFDPAGSLIASGSSPVSVAPLESGEARVTLEIETPELWSLEKPTLYRVQATLLNGESVMDQSEQTCGFRTLRFDPNLGFFLNEKPVKIKGVCGHQDHAGVGVAVPDSLWEFRLRRLKEMGANAYRSAHNPPAREFLDACDRLGMLVLDENRIFNPTPEYLQQLEWQVRRDRNHPSIFLWSVFNEEPMQATPQGYEMVRRMAAVVKRLDTTRPVTAAMSFGFFTPLNVSNAVDVVGFNYNQNDYDAFHSRHPNIPLLSTEDTSAYSTRGETVDDPGTNRISHLDQHAAPWGDTHRNAWRKIAERPFVAGGFVWTGFDYHGEPTPHEWPSVNSFFGCLDLCGFPKTAFYLHQAQWLAGEEVLKITPHWNFSSTGETVRLFIATNAEQVRLTLNGRLLGERAVDPYEQLTWEVSFEPGRLEAIGLRHGKEVSRDAVETANTPVSLALVADRTTLKGDGDDTLPVTLQAIDAGGRGHPLADSLVSLRVEGPGRLLGVGNGNPNNHDSETEPRVRLFHGLAQALLQAGEGEGTLVLTAEAEGLAPATLRVDVRVAALKPKVPEFQRRLLVTDWRTSGVFSSKPDPLLEIPANDVNSWPKLSFDSTPEPRGKGWLLLDGRATPSAALVRDGGLLVLPDCSGVSEIWINGKKEVAAPHGSTGLKVPFPPGATELRIRLLLRQEGNEPAGLKKRPELVPANG